MRKTDIETKPRPTTATKNRVQSDDPWRDWQPQWEMRCSPTPHIVQEKSAPTVAIAGEEGRDIPRRRLVDARLWDNLPPVLQDAATVIARSYEVLGRGMGFAVSDWHRIPGARSGSGSDPGLLTGAYMDWARACHQKKISHSMVIDVLCYGISCAALDRDRRVRRGTSRDNLVHGLELYAHLRGWIRHTAQ